MAKYKIFEDGVLLSEGPTNDEVRVLLKARVALKGFGIGVLVSDTWPDSVPEWNSTFGINWTLEELPANWTPEQPVL